VHPLTGVVLPVGDYEIELADQGTFRFDGQAITFRPDIDALVEMLRQDLVAHQGNYATAKLTEVWENGVYMGLEAEISPITYTILDEFGRAVTTTYYPEVFFPKPDASPDVSRGAINEPQRKDIMSNDDPSKGIAFEPDYLMIWDPATEEWGISDVETDEGVYSIEAGEGITLLTAGFGAPQKIVLATNISASGEFNQLVFMPNLDWTGTATPIRYQVRDVFGQKADSTFTPSIEVETVASETIRVIVTTVGRLARTGGEPLYVTLQVMVLLTTVGLGLQMSARRRRDSDRH
jgi:hypothetical protein